MSTLITETNNTFMGSIGEHYGVAHSQILTQTSGNDESKSEIQRTQNFRDSNGKLMPGCPALPGAGRPKGSGLVSDAIKQALREGKADEVKQKLFDLVDSADRDSVRLAAIAEIIDRSEGKATQNVRMAGVFLVAAPGAEALAALDGWAGSNDDE